MGRHRLTHSVVRNRKDAHAAVPVERVAARHKENKLLGRLAVGRHGAQGQVAAAQMAWQGDAVQGLHHAPLRALQQPRVAVCQLGSASAQSTVYLWTELRLSRFSKFQDLDRKDNDANIPKLLNVSYGRSNTYFVGNIQHALDYNLCGVIRYFDILIKKPYGLWCPWNICKVNIGQVQVGMVGEHQHLLHNNLLDDTTLFRSKISLCTALSVCKSVSHTPTYMCLYMSFVLFLTPYFVFLSLSLPTPSPPQFE